MKKNSSSLPLAVGFAVAGGEKKPRMNGRRMLYSLEQGQGFLCFVAATISNLAATDSFDTAFLFLSTEFFCCERAYASSLQRLQQMYRTSAC
jgi:hypothetical protein